METQPKLSLAEECRKYRKEFVAEMNKLNSEASLADSETKLKAAIKASKETTIVFNLAAQKHYGLNTEHKSTASNEKLSQAEKLIYEQLGLGKEAKSNQYSIVHVPSPREIVEGRVLGTSK